jgi:hypothetical protein
MFTEEELIMIVDQVGGALESAYCGPAEESPESDDVLVKGVFYCKADPLYFDLDDPEEFKVAKGILRKALLELVPELDLGEGDEGD